MKYKLINSITKEETLCDKITIDGCDYLVIETAIGCKYGISKLNEIVEIKIGYDATLYRGIICTNNPNTDIPKIVDEVEKLAFDYYEQVKKDYYSNGQQAQMPKSNKEFQAMGDGFIEGYNKSQETHPFSEEDMIEFAKWLEDNMQQREYYPMSSMSYKELLQIWKEQQPKSIWYE